MFVTALGRMKFDRDIGMMRTSENAEFVHLNRRARYR